jgi:hypothetical protein
VTAEEHTAEVRVDHLLPGPHVHVRYAGEQADTGVVDEDVEAAEFLDRAGHRAGRLFLPAHIGPFGEHAGAAAAAAFR